MPDPLQREFPRQDRRRGDVEPAVQGQGQPVVRTLGIDEHGLAVSVPWPTPAAGPSCWVEIARRRLRRLAAAVGAIAGIRGRRPVRVKHPDSAPPAGAGRGHIAR
ncbi:hypothetical protein STVA_23860 [Allostella vacuolata]|nr:hypothetical protein STVA_23860 [Stella vacuolata]